MNKPYILASLDLLKIDYKLEKNLLGNYDSAEVGLRPAPKSNHWPDICPFQDIHPSIYCILNKIEDKSMPLSPCLLFHGSQRLEKVMWVTVKQFPHQSTIFHINFQQYTHVRKSWVHPYQIQKSMLFLFRDCKNSWIWIIKHIFSINEKTFFNILDTFLFKIMKR